MITRHFVDVMNPDGTLRRVHYRKAGSGPPVVLVHQSPRSSAEYERLMQDWAPHFTLYAPDSPGFGDSQPLPNPDPEVEDFADAVLAFMDTLGLQKAGAYGFHSGAIILVTAAKRAPHRFSALAAGGYAVWTEAEKADFGSNYTPKFLPLPYGEHLAWLWGRILEQTWFFPWYRAEHGSRLPMATGDPMAVHPIVMEVLAAGDSFRLGYAAVLRANRDVPAKGQPTPPTYLTAYRTDPLHAHLARLGELPDNWKAESQPTVVETEAACRDWLLRYPAPEVHADADAEDEGFTHVKAGRFDGLIHWKGARDAATVVLPAPGSSAAVVAAPGTLAIDLPGHGLSDDFATDPKGLGEWVAVLDALDIAPSAAVVGHGASFALAKAWRPGATAAGPQPQRADLAQWRAEGVPDLTPDRYGAYLQRAWQAVRAATFFDPWFRPSKETAIPFDVADAAPEVLARKHLALMQARRGRDLMAACIDALDRDQ